MAQEAASNALAADGKTGSTFVGPNVGPSLPLDMPARSIAAAFALLELAYTLIASDQIIKARALIQLASTAARIVHSADFERRLSDLEIEMEKREREGATS